MLGMSSATDMGRLRTEQYNLLHCYRIVTVFVSPVLQCDFQVTVMRQILSVAEHFSVLSNRKRWLACSTGC